MPQGDNPSIWKPRTDDQQLVNIFYGLINTNSLFVAHDLKLFRYLADGSKSLEEICAHYSLQPRAIHALLSICASQNLLLLTGDHRYRLSEIAEDYLLEESPTYFGFILDKAIENREVFSFDSLKKAIQTNSAQIYGGEDLFQSNEEIAALTKAFTRAMHSKSMASATAWPQVVDLSGYACMLDVGGGSGAHSLGVVRHWPQLKAIVFERPLVCEVAQEFIVQDKLQGRVSTLEGDMWVDDFPKADLHFYCDILHDWPVEKCDFLIQKSYACLPLGGRILIHEMLFNDNKTGPFTVAAYNVNMLLWTQGQQLSGSEISLMLDKVGFVDVQVRPTKFSEWGIVTGVKNK